MKISSSSLLAKTGDIFKKYFCFVFGVAFNSYFKTIYFINLTDFTN